MNDSIIRKVKKLVSIHKKVYDYLEGENLRKPTSEQKLIFEDPTYTYFETKMRIYIKIIKDHFFCFFCLYNNYITRVYAHDKDDFLVEVAPNINASKKIKTVNKDLFNGFINFLMYSDNENVYDVYKMWDKDNKNQRKKTLKHFYKF